MKEHLPFHYQAGLKKCGAGDSDSRGGSAKISSGTVAPLKGGGGYRVILLSEIYKAKKISPVTFHILKTLPSYTRSDYYKLKESGMIIEQIINDQKEFVLSPNAVINVEKYLKTIVTAKAMLGTVAIRFSQEICQQLDLFFETIPQSTDKPKNNCVQFTVT